MFLKWFCLRSQPRWRRHCRRLGRSRWCHAAAVKWAPLNWLERSWASCNVFPSSSRASPVSISRRPRSVMPYARYSEQRVDWKWLKFCLWNVFATRTTCYALLTITIIRYNVSNVSSCGLYSVYFLVSLFTLLSISFITIIKNTLKILYLSNRRDFKILHFIMVSVTP